MNEENPTIFFRVLGVNLCEREKTLIIQTKPKLDVSSADQPFRCKYSLTISPFVDPQKFLSYLKNVWNRNSFPIITVIAYSRYPITLNSMIRLSTVEVETRKESGSKVGVKNTLLFAELPTPMEILMARKNRKGFGSPNYERFPIGEVWTAILEMLDLLRPYKVGNT